MRRSRHAFRSARRRCATTSPASSQSSASRRARKRSFSPTSRTSARPPSRARAAAPRRAPPRAPQCGPRDIGPIETCRVRADSAADEGRRLAMDDRRPLGAGAGALPHRAHPRGSRSLGPGDAACRLRGGEPQDVLPPFRAGDRDVAGELHRARPRAARLRAPRGTRMAHRGHRPARGIRERGTHAPRVPSRSRREPARLRHCGCGTMRR